MLLTILEEKSRNQGLKCYIKRLVPFHCGFNCKNCEDGGIGMIKRNWADCVVELKIVFKGWIVSFPSYHIIRTIATFCLVDLTNVLVNYCPLFLFIFEPSSWVLKVSRVSQSIGSDRTQLRKCEVVAKDLGYPTFDWASNINWKFDASRND